VAEVQETPESVLRFDPGMLGVCWTDHELPFQASARVSVSSPLSCLPTAVQALAERHDTAENSLKLGRAAGLWMDHAVPFHASASGCRLRVVK
jgi:hypothetical protein